MADNKNESADATAEKENMHKKYSVRGLWKYLSANVLPSLILTEPKTYFLFFLPRSLIISILPSQAECNKGKYGKM